MPDGKEPALWFHDIYRKDKTPFSASEVAFIKQVCNPSLKRNKKQEIISSKKKQRR
jgi:hypothetical protein